MLMLGYNDNESICVIMENLTVQKEFEDIWLNQKDGFTSSDNTDSDMDYNDNITSKNKNNNNTVCHTLFNLI